VLDYIVLSGRRITSLFPAKSAAYTNFIAKEQAVDN